MADPTKGPWTLGDENNESAEVCTGDVAVELSRYSRDPGRAGMLVIGREEMLANARLIAAAPDLLEALERLLREEPNIYEGRLEASLYVSVDALEDARTAIAKARGTR